MKTRGFEVAKEYENQGIQLPVRSYEHSAGYDFFCAEDTVIEPIWKYLFKYLFSADSEKEKIQHLLRPKLVPTGVKAYMQNDEVLLLFNRSSNPLKRFLLLGNGVGVIDADYYGNPDNDGHIMFQFINFGLFPITLKKGEKIGQGIFQKFLKADRDNATGTRIGGFGSSGK